MTIISVKYFICQASLNHPQKISTVQEVLCQVKEKGEALKSKEADLVLDHAISQKV